MYRPEVVRDDVEDAEDKDKEDGGPFGLEADSHHDAGCETNNRDEDASDAPFSLDDKSKEEEDKENTASEEETATDRE